jgi:hypothetical protein
MDRTQALFLLCAVAALAGCGAGVTPHDASAEASAEAPACHPLTEEERIALRFPAEAAPATLCGSVESGTFSYTTAGPCACVESFVDNVQQAPKCTPCMMAAPPQGPLGPPPLPLVYVTPPDGCPAAVGNYGPEPDRTPARVYTRQQDLPLRADCPVSPSKVEIDQSDHHIVGIPLPGSSLEALTVEGDTVTATFTPIPCGAGGVDMPRIPGQAPPVVVPDLRPLLVVPAAVTKIVLVPPTYLVCPPASPPPAR